MKIALHGVWFSFLKVTGALPLERLRSRGAGLKPQECRVTETFTPPAMTLKEKQMRTEEGGEPEHGEILARDPLEKKRKENGLEKPPRGILITLQSPKMLECQ